MYVCMVLMYDYSCRKRQSKRETNVAHDLSFVLAALFAPATRLASKAVDQSRNRGNQKAGTQLSPKTEISKVNPSMGP